MLTKRSFMNAAVASSSNDSCAITWHQWHAAYPTLNSTGTLRRRASSNAAGSHSHHSTGLSACWRRYGEGAEARRLGTGPSHHCCGWIGGTGIWNDGLVVPPSTRRMTPVTQEEAGEARYNAAAAMSLGLPIRPIGVLDSYSVRSASSPITNAIAWVSTPPTPI